MQLKKNFLLIVSTIMYSLPFLFTDYTWFLIFFFFFPFLFAVYSGPISLSYGFIWGFFITLFNAIVWIDVLLLLTTHSYLISFGIVIGMCLYIGLLCALLFWITNRLITFFFSNKPIGIQLLPWILSLCIFFEWIDNYCLAIAGVVEGYPLMTPLLPLLSQPALLRLLPYLGNFTLTLLLLLISYSLFLLIIYKTKRSLLFVGLCFLPWIYWYYTPLFMVPPYNWIRHIKSLPLMMCSKNPYDYDEVVIKIIQHKLKAIISEYPDTEVIIMPESAFTIDCFESLSHLLILWSEKYIQKPLHIVFGAMRREGDMYYNSLYWVYNGTIQLHYDKTHCMLMSERLPWWLNNASIRSLFYKNNSTVHCSSNKKPLLTLLQQTSFVPYICSEFFLKEIDPIQKEPLIVIANDTLFSSWYSAYIQRLLIKLAQYKAIKYQNDIIYISYEYSIFITKTGMYYFL